MDIAGTPMTNTLALRRLALRQGEGCGLRCVYLDTDSWGVHLDAQRYVRLDVTRYRFESPAFSFSRELDVDGDLLVLDYQGLFTRIG